MSVKSKKEKIQDLMLDSLELQLAFLQKKLVADTISHQELEVLRKLLHDNQVSVKITHNDAEGGYNIVKDLPFEIDTEYRN